MISHVYMAKRAEGPRGLSHPPGTAVPPASGTPPGGSGKVGEAASEKVPGSEKGPDRTTASGWACGRNGCPAGRAEGGAPQGQWGGGGHTHSGGQALLPSLAETRTPLPALPESCIVSCRGCTWSTTEFSALLHSLVPTGPTGLGAVEAHPGFSWATSLPGRVGGSPELGAPGRKLPSFIVYHQQTR